MICPFLDQPDSRCAVRLSLNKLDEALGFCAHRFQNCPLYHKKLAANALTVAKPVERLRLTG